MSTINKKPISLKPFVPRSGKPRKTLQELMEEQGVVGKCRIENIEGKGRDLWASDAEFNEFLKIIDDFRKQGRVRAVQKLKQRKKRKQPVTP